ncbi:hypothetical protein SAMD00019534_020350 [Acytostelium subglobosum LB1]|uniref:hypothetical protein n=1 Tax=Acytostelium subglobosum LB1 TaxID=1410327 RepID=UPI000644D5DE|nr:hypothetical protein SAMD00019534_020350 [Acytostelium subglobosum LB1]GAM18860.1 hypothetical protein SAMD00019534_020350 [Acytostelium subglobosum LB1]|eukprot:XP_012758080.1 hypothetical protein SAMD00019534_020350 [Acytostelium subglobosum LB1]
MMSVHKPHITCIIVIILTVLLINVNVSNAVKIESATMTHRTTNVVGVEMEYALMDITFDKDVYIYDSVACPNYTCPTATIDCTCDYTDPKACPKTGSGDPSCPPCPATSVSGKPMCDFSQNPWVTLIANQAQVLSNLTDPVYIRYKAATNYCEALRLYVSQDQGGVEIRLNTIEQNTQSYGRIIGYGNVDVINFMNICPTDNAYAPDWTNNTYFIKIIPTSVPATISVVLLSGPISKPEPTAPKCNNLTETHQCVNDGDQVAKEITEYYDSGHYTYSVNQPQTLTISCPTLQQDIDFYVSLNPNDPFPSNESSDYAQFLPGDDELTLTLAPHADGSPLVLYVTIMPYYPSNYSCVFTTTATRFKRSIADNFGRGGSLLMMGTSDLTVSGTRYQCLNWGNANPYTALFPRTHNNPLWPVPYLLSTSSLFNNINFFDGMVFEEPSNLPKARTYQAAYLLSYSFYGTDKTVLGTIEELEQAQLGFKNILVDIDGLPVTGPVTFTLVNATCNYTDYQTVLTEITDIEETIFASMDYSEVSTLRYKLDTYTLRDGWYGCYSQATELLTVDTVDTIQSSTICPYQVGDPLFNVDPCCNTSNAFMKCCAPRNITVPVKSFVGLKNNMVKQQCSSYDCTLSVLDEYHHTLGGIETGECSISDDQYKSIRASFAEVFRSCKKVYDKVPCSNDAQCGGNLCNLYTRTCEPTLEVQDKSYINCIVNQSLPSTLYFLKYQVGLQNVTDNSLLVDLLYTSFLKDDCASYTGLDFRTTYSYDTANPGAKVFYPSPKCLDQYCVIPHDFKYEGIYAGFQFLPTTSTQAACAANAICPSTHCTSQTPGCITSCPTTGFCGHCSHNQSMCHTFAGLTSDTTCGESNNVCLLPNGQSVPGLTDQECANRGSCSKPCGMTCTGSYTGCVVATAQSQDTCNGISGAVWHVGTQFCSTSDTVTQCHDNGYTWVNCSTMDSSSCFSRVGQFANQTENICKATPVECQTREQCETQSGQCSDSYYFDPSTVKNYPAGFGKCVHGHHIYFSYIVTPTCNQTEHDSPKGCYSLKPKSYNVDECKAMGDDYSWWTQATTKDACLQPKGCLVPDSTPSAFDNQFRFNEMSMEECGLCTNQWTNMFQWTQGQWLPGVPVKPKWIPVSGPVTVSSWRPVFDFQSFSVQFGQAFYGYLVDLLRSSAMCRMERLQNNLQSISCSCSGPGGSQCFSSSALMIGSTSACAMQSSNFTFAFGALSFTPYSVPISCVNVIVSHLSKQQYKATSYQSLSSNFVSYKKPDNFGILNERGAVIGSILNDGIKIQARGVNSLTVCLLGGSTTSEFPVFDFAEQNENKSSLLTPLNLKQIVTVANPDPSQPSFICANITLSSHEPTYFPIIRVSNNDWKSNKREVFDKTATALLYTLGCLFGINALWGIFQLTMVLYTKCTQPNSSFKLVQLLILTVTVFITIRAVYFFILPSGKLSESQVADYILVVLPTFIYFTAFTVIIVIWYIIVSSKIHINFFSRFNQLVGIINVVLYVLFIIIVLVFNYTKLILENDCGARRVIEVSSTTPQRIVSIFYATVQAVISLLIGAAFVYLGVSIHMLMKVRRNMTDRAESKFAQQQKIFLVTATCSVGFVLHCAFVLVLVGAEPSNVIFSFIGLIVTEIIPTMSILYAYNQGHLSVLRWSTSSGSNSLQNVTPSFQHNEMSATTAGATNANSLSR